MITNIYTVHDAAVGAYLQPFYSTNDAVARRSFRDAAAEKGHLFNTNPQDYVLFKLGTFDDVTATFTIILPQRICGALDLLPPL